MNKNTKFIQLCLSAALWGVVMTILPPAIIFYASVIFGALVLWFICLIGVWWAWSVVEERLEDER